MNSPGRTRSASTRRGSAGGAYGPTTTTTSSRSSRRATTVCFAVYPDQQESVRLDEPGQDLVTDLAAVGLEGDELREAFRAVGLKPVVDL